jgi:hypothetical protein
VSEEQPPSFEVKWWQAVALASLAGGLGWGIRGQYGHETGAMIAGLLVSLTLVLLFGLGLERLTAARAVAWGTIAMGLGGSMTYGQTIGLTQNAPLVGNWEALRWGLLGLAIKGGIWIGFAGAFLGMGLGGVRYRMGELLLLMLGLLALYGAGVGLFNMPFDPATKQLPRLYFSADWRWEPDATLKPRFECWGGLLLALIGVWVYAGWLRRDRLARRLALWGALGGAMGFPGGQCLQAFHAWNPAVFTAGFWLRLDPVMNWWNVMETTFGAIMGAALGLGLWLNRRFVTGARRELAPESPSLTPALEALLLGVHGVLLLLVEFTSIAVVNALYDLGLMLGLIPIVAVAGGRWWPYLVALPLTMLPIAGKTIHQLVYSEHTISPAPGWLIYGVLPLALTLGAAWRWGQPAGTEKDGRDFARRALWLNTWLYFSLNFAFFHFPWPWTPWTPRTPNGLVFALCAAGLTVGCLTIGRGKAKPAGG